MTGYIPEPMRIRVVMSQLRTHIQNSCERGVPLSAQDQYEEMKAIVKGYPDDADLVATLGDSSVKLMDAYTKNGMVDRAKQIAVDIDSLTAKLKKNPELEKQVVEFLRIVYGQ